MKKLFLTDVDGCLFDYNKAFDCYMKNKGYIIKDDYSYNMSKRYGLNNDEEGKSYIRQFNKDPNNITNIPVIKYTKSILNKIHKNYRIVCITSMSVDNISSDARRNSLLNTFGDIFDDMLILPLFNDKKETLSKFKNTNAPYVEDYGINADIGLQCGLKSILLNHDYNKKYNGHAKRANNWKEIYDIINEI